MCAWATRAVPKAAYLFPSLVTQAKDRACFHSAPLLQICESSEKLSPRHPTQAYSAFDQPLDAFNH